MSLDRAAFRAWVRTHHPDVGGDPEEFRAGLERRAGMEGRRSGGEGGVVEVTVFRSRGGLWLLARWVRRRRRGERRVV